MTKHFDAGEFERRPVTAWLNRLAIGISMISLLWLEKKYPLRRSVEEKFTHDARNLLIAALSALSIRLTEKPLTERLMPIAQKRKLGLLNQIPMPVLVKTSLAVILLDYTLYLWHVLTHKNPFLWRFHEVQHVDLDLTATTAIRFHFGEMAISAIYRSGQVLVIGVSAKALSIWQLLTILEILFHHSNLKLPLKLERWLNLLIVTPRMHAIHHSTRQDETDSNWSSGLSIWDRLHGTLRLNVPQNLVRIGVPAYSQREDLNLMKLITQPFHARRDSWRELAPSPRSRAEGNEKVSA